MKPLRSVADYKISSVDKVPSEDEIPVRLCNYTDVYNREFITPDLPFMEATATADEIQRFSLRPNDVIITKDSESWDDIGIPALVRETAEDLVCGYHLAILRPRKGVLDGAFLFRCLQAKPVRVQLELAANGVTRFGIPKDAIGSMALPVPPLPQQVAIAAFLDREMARLDALVAAKERLLEILAEKRRAIITHAVTRGLNPDAPLRHSGIPWLSKIPGHWEALRLKFTNPEITVGIVVTPAKYYEKDGVPCLRSLNVSEKGIVDADLVFISEESNILLSKSRIFAGDLVAVRSGQPGTTAVVDDRFDGANCIDLIIIRRSALFASAFLAHFLNSQPAKMQFLSGSGGAIQQHFNIETAKDLVVPLPPMPEQRAIVSHITSETTKLDALRASAERTIALLKERRSALIAAAVTGQIDPGSPRRTMGAGA
jgi:type I restriction enzyme S subunit